MNDTEERESERDVCVCEGREILCFERERERERECVCVCVKNAKSCVLRECVCVWVKNA